MKSLADLKRTIKPGLKIEHVARMDTVCDVDGNRSLVEVPIPPKLKGVRTVTTVDTTGFYMSKDDTKGSFLGFPKASDLSFEAPDGTFTVLDRTKDGTIWLKMKYKIIT